MQRYLRFIRKLLRGEDVTQVRHTKAEWERQFGSGQWDFLLRNPYNVAVTAGIIRRLSFECETLRVLDVGCGNGALARELNLPNIAYVGTDISEEALKQAAELYAAGEYKAVSMEEDPGLTGQFDVIVFSEILLYGDYQKVLAMHKPYLKPDGVAIISLYDTWRTKIIWYQIAKYIKVLESVYVKNTQKNIGWNIKVVALR